MNERRKLVDRDLPPYIPTLYPIVVGTGYVALVVVANEISISAAARVVVLTTVAIGVISVLVNLLMLDRNRGGVLALSVVLLALFGEYPRIAMVVFAILALVVIERVISFRRATRVPWRFISRVGNALAVILILMISITGVQNGTWGRLLATVSSARSDASDSGVQGDRLDVYVILLDGYERPSKMPDVFGYSDT